MEPQTPPQDPQNPSSPPQPAPSPVVPSPAPAPTPLPPAPQPTPAVAPLGAVATAPIAPPAPSLPPIAVAHRSKLPLIIGIVVGVVALIVVAFAAFLFFMGKPVVNASNNFMKYETSGQVSQAIQLSTASTDSEKSYLQQASTSTKGSYKLVAHKTGSDKKAYFLYSLTNSTNKFARTTVEKVDGEWKVTSYVFSSKEISVIPGTSLESSVEESTGADADEGPDVTMPTTSSGSEVSP